MEIVDWDVFAKEDFGDPTSFDTADAISVPEGSAFATKLVPPITISSGLEISGSALSNEYDAYLDGLINTYHDVITTREMLDRIQDYEIEFGKKSEDFFKEWKSGSFEVTPETSDWASIYRSLLIYDDGK